MSADAGACWIEGLKRDYHEIFVEEWSPYLGAVLMILIIIGLMVSGLFWGIYGGLKLWGDYFNNLIGIGPLIGVPQKLETLLMHRMSLMNITLVLGAFCAALLSRQFQINRPPKLEYVWATVGGCLMGLGATMAGGCTSGGFFTPVLHSSPAGWMMWAGLIVGAIIGLKALLWTLDHIEWGMQAPPTLQPPAALLSAYPLLGLGLIVAILYWATDWYISGNDRLEVRGVLILAGFALGFIMHRSRLCFARCFREPFMTAEGHMTKAIILGLAIGLPIASLLIEKKLIDPYLGIPPTFWIGSLLGGLIFGIGMIFAGGCASGSLWRMGEGHLKLWVAAFFFAVSGSISNALLKKSGLMVQEVMIDETVSTQMGIQAYFPLMLGNWGWALLVGLAALLAWYILVSYNECTEKFTVL
ncbi:MAG: YeeE/YedE family protein [Betaproteobacteria bacterium]|nr:YeeE/YedE family protein [Betaproteobacteria bacterium]